MAITPKKHRTNLDTEILGEFDTEEQLKELGRFFSELWDVVKSEEFANLRIEEGDGGVTSQFINYQEMKSMPRGEWKRPDLRNYNQTRVNPVIAELMCPWCGEKGYGYEFRKKHLVTSHKTKVDPKRFNCEKNPHRKLNYNEKVFLVNGEKLTINDISERYSLPWSTIQNRLFQGQTIEEIINKPLTTNPRYQFDGQDLTINEIAKLLGASRTPIEKLTKKNQSIDQYKKRLATLNESKDLRCEICGKVVTDKRQVHLHFENCKQTQIEKQRNVPKHLYKGEQKTIEEICENEGINPAILKDRLRKGKTLSEAVKMGVSQKEKQINFRDKQYSVSEFCKEFGISNTTFYRHRNSYELPELTKKFAKVKPA